MKNTSLVAIITRKYDQKSLGKLLRLKRAISFHYSGFDVFADLMSVKGVFGQTSYDFSHKKKNRLLD